MQSIPQLLWRKDLKSMIDFQPLIVGPETLVSDAIALMASQGKSALVGSSTEILGGFSQKNLVKLVAGGIDLKTTKISEVMQTPILKLKLSEVNDLTTLLSQLRQSQVDLLPIVDENDCLFGVITLDNVCQVLEQQPQSSIDQCDTIDKQLWLLESVIASANDAIVITEVGSLNELDPRIVYANTAFTRMCGYNLGEIVGKTPRMLQGKQTSQTELAKIRTALQTGSTIKTELLNYKKDGTPYWVEMSIYPIKDEAGTIIYFAAIQRDITKRKADEASIKQTAELFQQLTENIPQVFFVRDAKEEKIYYVSPAYAQIWGRNSDRLDENLQEYLDSIHPQDRDRILAARENLLLGESFNGEYRIIRPDGELRWIASKTFPIKNEFGEIYRIVGIAEDITILKQTQADLSQANAELERRVLERTIALEQINQQLLSEISERQIVEDQLRDSEERFRNLVEASSDLVWEVDEKARYTYVSPQIREILGYEPEQLLGKTPLEFMPLSTRTILAESFAAFFLTPQIFQCLENIQMHQDGHLVVLETSGIPVFDSQGQFTGYRGMSRDVTQRHQAAASLRETQKQLQAILDNSSAAIFVLDIHNRYLLINSQYEKLFNLKQAEIVGKSVYDIWDVEIADQFVVNNRPVITNGNPIEVEEVVPQGDGLHTYLSNIFPLKDTDGNIYAICGISTDITERKIVEESLLSLRQAIESTSDGVVIVDITGKGIYFNPAFLNLYEYTQGELQAPGGLAAIFQQPQDREELYQTLVQGNSWHQEVTMRSRSGRTLQVYLRADAIKDATGKVLGIVCNHTDITHRQLVEAGLRLRDRAIAASSNGIIIADASIPNGPIIYVNSAFERMTGYSATEVIGQNFNLFHNNENQAQLQQLIAAMQAGEDCTVILRNYRQDGELLWTKLNISPVYDVAGTLTHYIGIQTDITERKQAETALLLSQQRLQYLLASSPAVIYSCKVSGDFGATFISENVKAMMGYEAREFREDSSFWANRIHPDDVSDVFAKISEIFSQGYHSYEYRFLHKDGNYRWVYDQVHAIKDEAGNFVELVGYWADITERKQLEQELITALEKEIELNELKSRFITMTSHEFRTPLSTILSSSELLEHYRHKWTDEKQLIHIHRIQTSVHRMTEMLNDILFIGKAEAGILEYHPTSFDLVAYCHNLVAEVQLDHQQHRIDFHSPHEFIECYMDEKLLKYILSNLLTNAIIYSPDTRYVNFTLTCQNGRAIFEIQDQGIGIPEADLPYLFASFHRASNVGNIIGTGLGLAIVKKCVDIHQGEIFVTTQLGVGTTFTVTLPMNQRHE
ncbi:MULTISPECIES: PAS domain S-box protein [unclassified Tolypothrix]|uniref:PAS domain S-box protein n=1 Tax=unclassified Tolypothrix TaxID=2649714 RepID=UPI0005EAABD0|nr:MULTISPECIES: PAS domain S-box protein [unclassified Tolypothrix]BAY88343.1 multi-sensor signal transduction histidine kinase [Microchaete diplosiphon NIES-3275]EKF02293.1 sensor histidine kinase [Tolypothrix sp. PCC 7601]MBE9084417.1 PAS domain S-box protein [Tolypothrix sp. LEGE 11397]UYD29030.1 PAS domain S-box protein [Tolypothrix sp. PCC 7712]UYD35056.1 PAS domain S-box protein [Tolypothrix sp. PCC 7601]